MQDKNKVNRILGKIITFVFGAIVLFAIAFFVADLIKGKRPDLLPYKCDEISEWTWVREKENVKLRLPCYVAADPGETVVLERKAPDEIYGDMWIDYFTGRDSDVYVGDSLRLRYRSKENTIIGGVNKSIHMYIPLEPGDEGKTIRIVRCSKDNSGSLNTLYVGTALGLVERIIVKNVWHYISIVTLLIIAVFSIAIGFLLNVSHKGRSHIGYVGFGVLLVGLWLILDSELYQFAFRNYFIDGTMSFIVTCLMPIPFIIYLNALQKNRYKRFFIIVLFFQEVVTITLMVLNFTYTYSFLDTFPFMAFAVCLVIGLGFVTLVIDFFKKYYIEYMLSFWGLFGLAASGIIEMILILNEVDRIDGSFLVLGMYFLLFMTIVHEFYLAREFENARSKAIIASEAKSNFLANMSHEIRTPMNAILGMCELILRESDDREKVIKHAGDIKSSGNLLLALINDILDISRIESGKAELLPVEFEICSVFNDIINISRTKSNDKNLYFNFNVSEDVPYKLYGDEIRIRQIILNVVNNAIKYTSRGGVDVDVKFDYDTQSEALNRGILRVKVSDTGIGIKEENIKDLFKSFGRLEESRNRNIEGTGLGLNITYTYITMMGGTIDIDSTYGKGSTFTLNIPLQTVGNRKIGSFAETIKKYGVRDYDYLPAIMAPRARILVVDDLEMNIEVVAGLLKETMIKVDRAVSGAAAIEMFKDNHYDLVLLDQMMPEMDGIRTLQILRDKYDLSETPVIALTADAISGAREFYLNHGFSDYLSKPIKPEDLEAAVKKWLPRGLLLNREEIERLRYLDRNKERANEDLRTLLVIDPDVERLKEIRSELSGLFRSVLLTDVKMAEKYLKGHTVDYVLVDGKLYVP